MDSPDRIRKVELDPPDPRPTREALEAIVGWGDRVLARRTVCMIAPQNGASAAVARRCGYRAYARTIYRDAEVELYERPPRP